MTTGKALEGTPYAGNPHARFDEGGAGGNVEAWGSTLRKAIDDDWSGGFRG